MNFLAHLHIAEHCQSDLLGNLLGDFVKGNPYDKYPHDVASGILMHRFVDSYTDSHDVMRHCKSQFASERRRYAFIALDMFWDHCLADSWQHYHDKELAEFCHLAKTRVQQSSVEVPQRFQLVSEKMWQQHWLESYRDFDTVLYALERMSTRSLRMAPLATCAVDLKKHYSCFYDLFAQFYPELLHAASSYSPKDK
ncbi:ACP phosphodiesterase [Vibrio sp. ZSDZ34]|jgi:acyl carrier protein phosphodiesterase|uniref:ACP phosphodiesterase n=1 Tax=Vibrio gelatinilyticus TaxID=2893468 RepID=A0A9X2AVN5_9VIBR|nr:ACP phosphodiesterase [Vibrio gelatinilyticus]MCJ2377064.1 ACP phosphodiesterase [Vibrio gelatinilyticus]